MLRIIASLFRSSRLAGSLADAGRRCPWDARRRALGCGVFLGLFAGAMAQPPASDAPGFGRPSLVGSIGQLSPQEVVAGIDERIESHRKMDMQLRLLLPGDQPVPEATTAHVKLVRHEFLFGCNLFSFDYQGDKEDAYRQRIENTFNYATLNFIWEGYEPQSGQRGIAKMQRMVSWCQKRGIATKGHTLVWNLEPPWTHQSMTADQTELLVWRRIAQEMEQFRGAIDRWDVVNEPTEGESSAAERGADGLLHAYRQRGTAGTLTRAFSIARKANPDARLLVNDYVTTDAYARVLDDAIRNGAPIDVIGIQSHMHTGCWQVARLWDVCNRFGKFGKPIHFTELSILSGALKNPADTDWKTKRRDWVSTPEGEARQAAEVYQTYRLLFSHPAVAAITWWDVSDRGAWMGAPAGLLRNDMSPKPAYYRVHDLIHKGWTTERSLPVDADGMVALRGFFGEYQVAIASGDTRLTGVFRLSRNAPPEGPVDVRMRPD